jgi:hypothetical protein
MTTHTEAQLLRAFNAITLWAIDVLKRHSVMVKSLRSAQQVSSSS